MADVITSGFGEVERIADRAGLRLSYSGRGVDRSAAVTELTGKIRPVEARLAVPGVEIRAKRLAVHTTWERKKRTSAQATQTYVLRITDLSTLDELVGDLIATEPASLNGPDWELADRAEPAREAQALAVAKARAQAEGYAAALGGRLGELVQLTDGGAVHREVSYGYAAAAPGGAAPRAYDVADLALTPQPVQVSASCTITWTFLTGS